MADIRSIGASTANLPAAPRGAARAESVRAAQAAFFQAALQETAPPSARGDTPVKPASAASRMAFDPSAPQPERFLRPGSLVDLKV
ncbi:MAG: hypothetical protein INR64_09430 [Caulobacteraceae bacterium]|nr:hypothetical protein [Caulobacter sp.]